MRSLFLSIILVFITLSINAQNFAFGPILGLNSYNIDTNSDALTVSDDNFIGLNLGVYLEHKLLNRFTGKFETIFSSSKEGYFLPIANSKFTTKNNTLQFVLKLIYDFGGKANEGIFITSGTRFGILINSSDDSSSNIDTRGLYKKNYFAGQMGLGIKFEEHYTFEILADATLNTPINEFDNAYRLTFFANLSINLNSLIK